MDRWGKMHCMCPRANSCNKGIYHWVTKDWQVNWERSSLQSSAGFLCQWELWRQQSKTSLCRIFSNIAPAFQHQTSNRKADSTFSLLCNKISFSIYSLNNQHTLPTNYTDIANYNIKDNVKIFRKTVPVFGASCDDAFLDLSEANRKALIQECNHWRSWKYAKDDVFQWVPAWRIKSLWSRPKKKIKN